jgi:hypothetical protein
MQPEVDVYDCSKPRVRREKRLGIVEKKDASTNAV